MKYAILFRTHYWSSYLEARLDEIRALAPSADVHICYDVTHGDPPIRADLAPHSTGSLSELGLHMPKERALWHCGDYPFYGFYSANPQYDFYLMIENDVFIKDVNIDSLVNSAMLNKTDVLGAHFQNLTSNNNTGVFSIGRNRYDVWRKCFFPIVGLRRSALLTLFAERVRQSERITSELEEMVPFCETYVGSEASKQGLKMTEIGSLAPLRTYGANVYVLHDKVAASQQNGIWHSVFPSDRFIDACLKKEYDQRGKDSFTSSDLVGKLIDAQKYAKVPLELIKEKLYESTMNKQNKRTFLQRIDEFIVPAMLDLGGK